MTLPLDKKLHIHYPCSDGKPMADNTRQWNWINFIKNGLEETTAGKDIFVAGDLLWYPVEGNNKLRVAPDVMVAIGRPKGDRNSYLQWKEDFLAPQIVFEILSPGNTKTEMAKKLKFYQNYGVEEYYIYNPDTNQLEIRQRKNNKLEKIQTDDWGSPLLQFRILWTPEILKIFHPDGSPFLSYMEFSKEVKSAKQEVTDARREAKDATEKAKDAGREAKHAKKKAAILAAKLRELGVDPESLV